MTDKSPPLLWWIIALALAVRLAVIPLLGPDNDNLYEYGQIAWNIVQGYGFSWDFDGRFPRQPTAYSPALYCYTLVPWFALFGLKLTAPRIMHALFLASVCWFLYKIGERLVNRRVGLIAAAVWALYPELIFVTVRIVPENVMFLPMIAALYLAQGVMSSGNKKKIFLCGVLTGTACWVNPSLQVLVLAIPLSWWVSGRLRERRWIKRPALFFLGVVLVIAPWTIRNYVRLGAFVPLRSAFAYNMWRGNHPGATGTVRTFEGTDIDEAVTPEYRRYYEEHMVPDEIERDRFFAAEVKRFIRENPGEYLKLTLTRLYYYWWRDETHPLTVHPLYWIPWTVVLAFTLAGAVFVRRKWRDWSLWWWQILGFTALFSLTIVLPRYRMPLYPALFLLAAVGIERLLQRLGLLKTN